MQILLINYLILYLKILLAVIYVIRCKQIVVCREFRVVDVWFRVVDTLNLKKKDYYLLFHK